MEPATCQWPCLGFAFVDYSNTPIAGIVEASVDRASGKIAVHDVWCVLDCGIPVHPNNVVAQTESSIVYGLGMSLMERITVKDGAIRQSNFFDYPVPRMNEIPEMHIEVIRTENRPTGVGQMATPIMAPAIANAVARLTGKRLRESPMTPDRVKRALARANNKDHLPLAGRSERGTRAGVGGGWRWSFI